jgi:4-oxalocrotonate tautomerase
MPVIDVTLVQGRSPERLQALVRALTVAAADSLDAPIESVRIILREVPPTHFAAGGVTIAERSSSAQKESTDVR